jgi:hypothetical protein
MDTNEFALAAKLTRFCCLQIDREATLATKTEHTADKATHIGAATAFLNVLTWANNEMQRMNQEAKETT